jgi:hypothetical protein
MPMPTKWMDMTNENDSDEMLTQGLGELSVEVIEQGPPFALTACGFTQLI